MIRDFKAGRGKKGEKLYRFPFFPAGGEKREREQREGGKKYDGFDER